jgi:hypothetical protein
MIPVEFLSSLPEGIKYIHKHEKEFFVIEEVMCPNGHNLISEAVLIHGEPSIKINVSLSGQKGIIYIDAFWGSHAKLYDFLPAAQDKPVTVEASCPACGISLMENKGKCSQKGCSSTRYISFRLPGGSNKIYDCSRLGCPGHKIEITDLPHYISEAVSEINYFGSSYDEIFKGI